MRHRHQLHGAATAPLTQFIAQQRQRVRAKGGTECSVVSLQVFADRGGRQRHRRLVRTGQAGKQPELLVHAGDLPARGVSITGQRAQRTGIGQQRLGPGIQPGTRVQVGDVAEGPVLARPFDTSPVLFAKPRDHAQAHANRRLLTVDGLQAAIPVTGQHIHRAHLQPMAPRVLQDLVRAVEAHGPAVDQRTGEGRRLMAFEPATGVGQQGETGRVGLGKTIAAKAFDLLEDLRGKGLAVAVFQHAGAQAFLMRFKPAMAFPGGHRAPQLVGLAGAVVGGHHGDLHHLFLKQRHAQGALQHRLELRGRIGGGLFLVSPTQIRMHHATLNRPGPHDGDLNHQVVEGLRAQPRQHRHLRPRLDLEHTDGVGLADHRVGGGIFLGDVRQ